MNLKYLNAEMRSNSRRMKKNLGEKPKIFVSTEKEQGAAHEAGHLLGYLAISKIKNGRKYDLKSLRILNREQSEKIVLDTYGSDFLANNKTEDSLSLKRSHKL